MEEGHIYLLPNNCIMLRAIMNIIDMDTIFQCRLSVPVKLYLFSVHVITNNSIFIHSL